MFKVSFETYFTPYLGISLVNFEQIFDCWITLLLLEKISLNMINMNC